MHRTLALAALALAALTATACDGGKPTADPSAGPRVSILSPRMDQVIAVPEGKDPTVDASDAALKDLPAAEQDARRAKALPVLAMIDLQNYAIGKVEDGGNGQHLHVIVDNEPYAAVYGVGKGWQLPPKAMTPGTHVLRVFPSAGPKDPKGALHHESRKNPGAFAWVRFHVGAKGGPLEDFDGTKPLLTYSRPKGDYKPGSPELEKLMVDFYLSNVTLEEGGTAVRASLDGKVLGTWTTWKPQVLPEVPAAGAHKLLLELVDGEGKPIDGPFNRTERTFKVLDAK